MAKRGPFWKFYEHIPKVPALTAMVYIIATYLNMIFDNVIPSDFMSTIVLILVTGAIIAIPVILIDLVFTNDLEPGELILIGFMNFIALLTEYSLAHWGTFWDAATYAFYIYTSFFVIALLIYFKNVMQGKAKLSGGSSKQ